MNDKHKKDYVPGDELVGRAFGSVLWVNHEEHVGEAGAEVGAVGVVMPRLLGGVDVHALRAVELHHGLACNQSIFLLGSCIKAY